MMRISATDAPAVRTARQLSPLLRVALVLGILVHFLGFLIFRIASYSLPNRQKDAAFIALVAAESGAGNSSLMEQASLFDSAPLFVPGEWSAAGQVFSDRNVADWRDFPDIEPDIKLLDALRPPGLSLAGVVPVQQPMDLLDLRFMNLLRAFGQKELEIIAFEDTGSLVQLTVIDGHQQNLQHLPDRDIRIELDVPPGEAATGPLVLYVNMSAPGCMIGAPVIGQSSGSAAWDRHVLACLRRPVTLAQLPAGYLQLRVFPE